ncbi:MAG TPA: hypothetical protein VIA18_17005 [Polyangia bacterium]|jgi:hypothetical protein|nr:hypothetical protein [Polyangia bacterium]
MSYLALDTLVAQIRTLPGEHLELSLPRAAVKPSAVPPSAAEASSESVDLSRFRARTAALLGALAQRVDDAVPAALHLAQTAWDQVDAFAILDDELRAETASLSLVADALAAGPQSEDANVRAAGVEARLAIDAAVGLVALVERRFASLLRLRLRSANPELMVDGRPFLDVAAALAEASRRWR